MGQGTYGAGIADINPTAVTNCCKFTSSESCRVDMQATASVPTPGRKRSQPALVAGTIQIIHFLYNTGCRNLSCSASSEVRTYSLSKSDSPGNYRPWLFLLILDCCFSFPSSNRFRPQQLHRFLAEHLLEDEPISCSITSA